MKKIMKLAGVAALAIALTQSLQANPITGSIGFSGVGVTYDTASAGTATAVTSWISPVVSGVSGTFATPSPFAVANGATVNFNPATWNFNTASTINNFWSVGGFTFNLLSSFIVSQVPTHTVGGVVINGFVVVAGTGTVSGNNYDSTTLSWSFTSQDPSSGSNPTSWSFSASSNSVPDGGATVMLLGIALSGVALLRKKLTA